MCGTLPSCVLVLECASQLDGKAVIVRYVWACLLRSYKTCGVHFRLQVTENERTDMQIAAELL